MSRRAERVAEAIRREASLLVADELRDPRIGFVTIIRATVSPDLRNATVYYSVLGEERDRKRSQKGLKSALSFVKKEIGDRLQLRYTPDIDFREDETYEYAKRIEDTLQKIRQEKEARDGGA